MDGCWLCVRCDWKVHNEQWWGRVLLCSFLLLLLLVAEVMRGKRWGLWLEDKVRCGGVIATSSVWGGVGGSGGWMWSHPVWGCDLWWAPRWMWSHPVQGCDLWWAPCWMWSHPVWGDGHRAGCDHIQCVPSCEAVYCWSWKPPPMLCQTVHQKGTMWRWANLTLAIEKHCQLKSIL
jgi:hypothetical protein